MDETRTLPETHSHDQSPAQSKAAKSGRASRPGKPWAIDIDVYLQSDGANPKFYIESCLPKDSTKPDDELLIFRNNGRPGFELRFHLWDLTGKGYRFPRNKDDAVWSKVGDDDCPDSEAHEVFKPIRVVDGPDEPMLVVHNDNPDEENGGPLRKFRYTLNVTTTGTRPYLPLDPGGDDQNGSRTFVSR